MVKKKNIRKTALFLCVVCLALSLVSCNAFNKAESTPSEPSEVKADTSIKVYKIGLLQFSENETQNIIRDALMSRIEEWGYNSERVNINPKNAKGSAEEAENICRQFVSSKVDLIIAISPEASKAAAKAIENTDVGLIFADTGDVKSTLGMDISAAPVKNITGVTVLHPVNNVLDFALTVNPELKTFGVIYNPDNSVSVSSLNSLKEYCTSKEIEVKEMPLQKTEDAQKAASELAPQVNAIYAISDYSVVDSSVKVISEETLKAKKPLYSDNNIMVKNGAFSSVSPDYRDIGALAADKTCEIVAGRPLAQIPVTIYGSFYTYLSQSTMDALGYKLSEEVIRTVVFYG